MKKMKSVLSLLLAACLLFALSGCTTLDDLRSTHAVYQNKEKTELLLDGDTYLLLPKAPLLDPVLNDEPVIVYATEQDVPLLLQQNGEAYELSDDGKLLVSETFTDDGYTAVFCREKDYDDMLARLQQPFVSDCICIEYYSVEQDKTAFFTLNEQQSQAVYTILQTVPPQSASGSAVLVPSDEYEYIVTLEESSADHLLRRDLADLLSFGGQLYLSVKENEVYLIPDTLYPTFYELMKIINQ